MVIFFQNKSKRLFFLLGSLVFLFSSICFSVRALIVSQVFFDDLNLEKNTFDAGGSVEGNFIVWNAESSVVPDLAYRFSLAAKDEEGHFSVFWDDRAGGNNFSLLPNQALAKNFSYQLPKKLAPGEYEFSVRLYNSRGTPMAWQEALITVNKTEGGVLDIQNGSFSKNGEKTGTEAFYDLGENPKISFEAANKSFFSVKAYPRADIYAGSVNGNPVKEIKKGFVDLNPGDSRNQEMDLAAPAGSNVYIVRVAMYGQDNNPISNFIYFRWTILNEGGAEIIEMRTDKPSYKPGEEAKIFVNLSAQSEAAKKGSISIKITGEEGAVAGQVKQEIDLKTGEVDVLVPIAREVFDPGIETVITDSQNRILDEYLIKIETGENKEPGKKPDSISWPFAGGLVFAGLAAIAAIVYFFIKRKKSATGMIAFFFVLAGLFLGGFKTAEAKGNWTEIPSSNPGVLLAADEPSPKSIYYLGGYIRFSGSVATELFEEIDSSQFEFFIGDLNGPVFKSENIKGEEITVIDAEATKAGGRKIESLGTASGLYKSDNGTGRVEYNASLKIPSDISYLGIVRFYIQFKGHKKNQLPWGEDSWLREVAYTEVKKIQKNTEGGFSLDFQADKNSAEKGEEINYTVKLGNDSSCARPPIDAVAILDRSGSMAYSLAGNVAAAPGERTRMDTAKDAIKAFLAKMDPLRDRVGLASYSNSGSLDAGPSGDNDFQNIKDALGYINTGGASCIGCGIGVAGQELADNGRAGAEKYGLLLAGGGANMPSGSAREECNDSSAQYAISKAILSGISFYTVGVGSKASGMPPNNFCKDPSAVGKPNSCCGLLNAVAGETKGTYSFASDGEELVKIYEAIAGAMIGQSFGTKITVNIPEKYFSLKSFDKRCSFDQKTETLNCLNVGKNGFLDCGGQTLVEPIEFRVEVKDTVPDGLIEIKAAASNQINQEKIASLGLRISSDDRPKAAFSCDSSDCGIAGCPSFDCCRCYNDALLKLINGSTSQSPVVQSIWSIKKKTDASYGSPILSGLGMENCSPQHLAAGDYTVKLKAVNEKGEWDETVKNITYLQGAKAGFSCSLDGVKWYGCEDKSHINPNQGATIWLSDVRIDPLEHSILSDGAGTPGRKWYKVDANGVMSPFNAKDNNSTVTTTLNRLPTIIGLELNDQNRPPVFKEHAINAVALPGWIEVIPF